MNVEHRHVKVDVNIIVNSLLKRVGEQNDTNEIPAYIRKAPSTLRKHSPSSFTPRVVSIGPLHRKDKNLQRFEVRKAAYVRALLSGRTLALTACVNKVASKIGNIRSYYDALNDYKDNKLAEMMVMDACFILSFIQKNSKDSILSLQLGQDQYIPYDLVLLENQIPFFVLEDIYECLTYPYKKIPLHITEFLLPLLKYVNLFKEQENVSVDDIHSNTKIDHILGYLHHYYRPRIDIPSAFPSSTIHSAVELDRAGVNFKPKDDPDWPMAMEVMKKHSRIFWFLRKCTLTMPALVIDDFTELVFRNLIAYEQYVNVTNPYVTSYARAMNMLIDTHEDVAKLVRSKVIVNHIGSHEEAANMINGICKEVVPKHFYYTQQWKNLDRNFEGYWPKKIVNLKRTYFHSPWSIIALFAGIVLFVLALLQTIFTIKSS